MRLRLMDLLACPICKNFPLKLIIIEEERVENRELKQGDRPPLCSELCWVKGEGRKPSEDSPCQECIKREVKTGVLFCNKCERWYPIMDTIPSLLPDKLRRREDDLQFLKKYEAHIPEIVKSGKPFNLSDL